MREQRRHERYAIPLEIKVTWPGRENRTGVTRDFSDGGAFLLVMFPSPPPVDTVMELQLASEVNGHAAPVLKARVVRNETTGIAFEFILTTEGPDNCNR